MMKSFKYLLLLFIVILCFSDSLQAQDYKSSAGVRLGTYLAVSYTNFISENKSIEALVGITREANQSELNFGAFYKMHNDLSSDLPTLTWYYGAGLFVTLEKEENNKPSFSPSAILGMEYTLENAPVNFFIDTSPFYKLSNGPKFNIHASMGVRYVFNYAN